MVEVVNFYLIPGVVLGCIYALGAIGVSMLFGILRFAHFAHGDVMTFGAYVALTGIADLGWPVWLAVPAAMAATAGLALVIDRLCYRPFRGGPPVMAVIASFGLALMVRSLVELIWGVTPVSYRTGIQRPLVLFDTIRIAERHLWMIAATLALVVALHLFLTRTRLGKAMRAMSDDATLARISGIDTEAVIRATWAIGAGLAAIAGVFLGFDTQLVPNMGWNLMLPVFAAAILGGIGSSYGAAAGGLVIGIAEELSTAPVLLGHPVLSPGYKTGLAFAVMVVLLIWRPTGLFRGRVVAG